jgi:glyoxylase-like metal-dependent hydrolase (beta-lactamase superfamily II)
MDFPSFCGLIHHPEFGWVLYDTGYAEHFFSATQTMPERLYRMALPIDLPPEQTLRAQLQQHGVTPEDIRLVVISHYHGDHVAGLKDFPNAHFIALRADTQQLLSLQKSRLLATLQGILPQLLPSHFFSQLKNADDFPVVNLPLWMAPFSQAFDLLGDGSLLGIALPGHSRGQLGLLISNADGRPVFFIGDACWSLPACREGRLPSRLTLFVTADAANYRQTFFNLQSLANREVAVSILPSHCTPSWEKFQHE